MTTKLFYQVLLLLGCLALLAGAAESVLGKDWLFPPEGWWRGAIAFWMLLIATRMVYPLEKK
jgi:hypothetical protein